MVIHFLLPAYNEAENIELQISKLFTIAKKLEFVGKVYVVNDGSTDPTEAKVAHLAKSNPSLILINHSVNGGPGKAFTTGYEYIIRVAAPEDAIISMDADNTHSEQTVQMMLARLQEGYELVIASVYATGGMFIGLPFIRYVLGVTGAAL
jgi:dolichol-phosphate mannosyltransferase